MAHDASRAATENATIGGEAVQVHGLDRALTWLIKAMLYLLGLVPAYAQRFVIQSLYTLARPFVQTGQKWLFRNIQHIYGMSPDSPEAQSFAKQVLHHQIAAAMETARALRHAGDIHFSGEDTLHQTLGPLQSTGQGMILITAHIGSWELMGLSVVRNIGDRFYVLAKTSKSAALTAVLDHVRERMGMKVLWTDRKSILRDMLAVLKKGGCLGFVMDQKPVGRVGPSVDFMGQATAFVSGPAQLAAKTSCPVVAVFCMREGIRRYRILSKTILPAGHAMSDQTAMTQMMASEIERVIRLYPEQWAWNYKRWRFDGTASH